MTDRKPALKRYSIDDFDQITERTDGFLVYAEDLPPAILNATAEELGAAVLAIEQFQETQARAQRAAALAAAKSTTAEEGKP